MNKRQAKRKALWTAAAWVETDLESGAEDIGGVRIENPEEFMKMVAVMEEIVAELRRRGEP